MARPERLPAPVRGPPPAGRPVPLRLAHPQVRGHRHAARPDAPAASSRPERLAFVDAVSSTHGHGDHLDAETLSAIGAPVVCPCGHRRARARAQRRRADRRRRGRGRSRSGLPDRGGARRASRRALRRLRDQRPATAASTTRATRHGSSRACDGVDVALVPINGKLGNLDGPEAARLAHDVRRELAVPCHYDMFEFNTATPDEFIAECERLGQPYRVLQPASGSALD